MSPFVTWSRWHRHWATPIVVLALLVGNLAPPLAKPAAADSGYTVSGTVSGPGGTVLGGITVSTQGSYPTNRTSTDSSGAYSVAAPSGSDTVWFAGNGHYADGCYDASASDGSHFATGFPDCTPINVTASGVTGINVTMPIGHSISGTVSGPGGTPLGRINIGLWGNHPAVGGITDPTGSYLLTALPGRYTVLFSNGCYDASASDGSHFTTNRDDCTAVDVSTSSVSGINVTMPYGYTISGTVSGPGGTRLDNIGVGVSGSNPDGTRTINGGTYSMTVLPGRYTVGFQDPSLTYATGCYDASASDGSHFTINRDDCTVVDVSTSSVSGINVELPLVGYTPAGADVVVTPAYPGGQQSPVTLTFSEVTGSGATALTTGTLAPALPAGYRIGSPATYYDLTTTAKYSGSIAVCISYAVAGITPPPTQLLHYENRAWRNITISVDPSNEIICGTTTSLSPFALVTSLIRQPVSISAGTAVGALSRGPFSSAAKIVRTGQSITIQFQLSPAISGARLGIWIARKSAKGTWSTFRAHTSRIANAAGVVRYTYRSTSPGQLAIRAYFAGDATHRPAWSPSRQVRWK